MLPMLPISEEEYPKITDQAPKVKPSTEHMDMEDPTILPIFN